MNGQIEIFAPRAVQNISTQVAISVERLRRKAGRIEPLIDAPLETGSRIAHHIRAIAATGV
jgi:hypothetical protein